MPRFLGQHFLRDPRILDRIADALDPRPDDVVVEIGSGEGTLTRRLAPRVKVLVAIEKDRTLAAGLVTPEQGAGTGRFPDNVEVVQGDALQVDWRAHPEVRTANPGAIKICGNIPYYITTPLIEKALSPPLPALVVFLVQAEVADRVVARPGTKAYGGLSVGVRCVAQAERLFTVKAGAFHPRPSVDSAVLRLTPRNVPLLPDGERPAFRRFVSDLFGRRRKQLGRGLRDVARLDKAQARETLASLGIDPRSRPEVLTPEQLVALHRAAMR